MAGIPLIEPYPMPKADDLPGNTARWTPDPGRAVLLIHDMQGYFLRSFPSGNSPADELVQNTDALRERCARLGMPIAYTAQPGGMTEEQRGLLKDFWGPGMRMDPADRQIIRALRPAVGDWIFTKWRYSAFFGTALLERMRRHDRDQLVLCGVYAHVGVLATAVEAFTNDIQTFLVADAVADFSADSHWLTLRYAAQCCAVIATTRWILHGLDRSVASLAGPGVREVAL
jgi:trans-2,3-dihydro-3-hydroxyanthranilic acid synthase